MASVLTLSPENEALLTHECVVSKDLIHAPGPDFLDRCFVPGSRPPQVLRSLGQGDLEAAIQTAIVNKRAGGQGLISGRKAFQRPFAEGVELLQATQNVYLDKKITLA